MAKKATKQSTPVGYYLLTALAVSFVLACVFGLPLNADKGRANSLPSTDKLPMITDSIGRLSAADSPSLRMSAARWLSTQYQSSPETVIRSLGDSLSNDPDPAVRAQAAASLGNIARQARDKSNADAQEKLIADILQKQYSKEASDTVRRCIVSAAAELDVENAGTLVDSATSDNDPAVKEEALRARIERDRRAQLKKLG